jgi:hypothetical protein
LPATWALSSFSEIGIRHPDHGGLDHVRMTRDDILDLGRVDVLASRDDHVVVAAVDEQAPVRVEVPDVTGGHETVDHVLGPSARVTLEEHLVADEDAPAVAVRDLVLVVVEELDDRPAGWPAGGSGSCPQVLRRSDRRPRDLGRAVEVVEDVAEALEPALDEPRREGRARQGDHP